MDDNLIYILRREAKAFGIPLDRKQEQLFALYYDEFQLWNAKINLTSLEGGVSFVIKHFVDSLLPLPLIPRETRKILDLGTGGGLPGVPLKIARPDLEVVLLDSSRKKTSFLKQVVAILGLSGIQVVTGRAEEFYRNESWAKAYDAVISRAAFKLGPFIEIGSRFLISNGLLFAMKGYDITPSEEEGGQKAAKKCGMEHIKTCKTTLPYFEETSINLSLRGTRGKNNPDGCFSPANISHPTALAVPGTDSEVFRNTCENGRSIIVYQKNDCSS